MRAIMPALFCGVAAYLLGAVPFGYIVSRLKGVDIRKVGSGNIGATNVFRCVGKGWGLLTFFFDAFKGFSAAFFFPMVAHSVDSSMSLETLRLLGAGLAIMGHNWPVYLRFKGGKGVATSAGALLGIAWQAVVIGFLAWIVLFLLTRYVSLASMSAAIVIAVAAWRLYPASPPLTPMALTLLAALIIWRHKDNIRRLLKGEEHRFQYKKKTD